jgi:hypothetical protein
MLENFSVTWDLSTYPARHFIQSHAQTNMNLWWRRSNMQKQFEKDSTLAYGKQRDQTAMFEEKKYNDYFNNKRKAIRDLLCSNDPKGVEKREK